MEKQSPLSVANFFIDQENNKDVDNIKVNKLVYVSLGFSLGMEDFVLFDEDVEAWKFGPVIPSVYHHFKKYKDQKIKKQLDADSHGRPITQVEDKENLGILKGVWEIYNGKNGKELVDLTHQEGTPWWAYYIESEKHRTISRDTIRRYYKAMIERAEEIKANGK